MKETYLDSQLLAPVYEHGFGMVLDADKLSSPRRGLIIEAHPDDSALSEGVLESLTTNGISMTSLTLTDGGARDLKDYTSERLVSDRKGESVNANRNSGVTDMFHGGLADGYLLDNLDEGLAIVQGVIAVKKPEFIIVTNTRDEHTDHAGAGLIALRASEGEILVYEMDTVTRKSVNNAELPMSHAFRMNRFTTRRRNKAYLSHVSQVTDLPPGEMADVRRVIHLPTERGKEVGTARAAVIYQANAFAKDVLSLYLERQMLFAKV